MKNATKSGSKKRAESVSKALPAKSSAKSKATVRVSTAPKAKERWIPDVIASPTLSDYFEIMTMAVFQAGTSWAMIHNKWNGFRAALGNFDPAVVAKFGDKDLAGLLETPGLFRSEKKFRAVIQNAKTLVRLDKEMGGFKRYLRLFKDYESLSTDIKKQFEGIGELSAYYFLFRAGESVPAFEQWVTTIEGDHPRMREMVEKARACGPAK
ncbi:MAG TPA: DNA-3-methyladenine glycosylase I [Chroococcales cyanobacterium]